MSRNSCSPGKLFLTLFLTGAAILPLAFAQQPSPKPATSPAIVPGFTVTITYSQKAMATLSAGKETVIVVGYLYGFPIPGTPKKAPVYSSPSSSGVSPATTTTKSALLIVFV
jgi:hypothetical protein